MHNCRFEERRVLAASGCGGRNRCESHTRNSVNLALDSNYSVKSLKWLNASLQGTSVLSQTGKRDRHKIEGEIVYLFTASKISIYLFSEDHTKKREKNPLCLIPVAAILSDTFCNISSNWLNASQSRILILLWLNLGLHRTGKFVWMGLYSSCILGSSEEATRTYCRYLQMTIWNSNEYILRC